MSAVSSHLLVSKYVLILLEDISVAVSKDLNLCLVADVEVRKKKFLHPTHCSVCIQRGFGIFLYIDHKLLNSKTQSRLLTTLIKRTFENIVGKGENAGNNVSYSSHNKVHLLSHNYNVVCKVFQDWSKILLFGKELTPYQKQKFGLV